MPKCKIISCLLHFKCHVRYIEFILRWSERWSPFVLYISPDINLTNDNNLSILFFSSSSFFSQFAFFLTRSLSVLPIRWLSVMRTPPWCSWRRSFGRTRLWGENTTPRSSTSPWRRACESPLSSGLLCCTETWSTSHTCSPLLTRYQFDSYAQLSAFIIDKHTFEIPYGACSRPHRTQAQDIYIVSLIYFFLKTLLFYLWPQLQSPESFAKSVQELTIVLQRTGDPANLTSLRPHLELLANIDHNPGASLCLTVFIWINAESRLRLKGSSSSTKIRK